MPATLKLIREGAFIELRRGTFDAVVDGAAVGSLNPHDTTEVSIDAGSHTLHIEGGRYSSPARSFDVVDGETIAFQLHGANLWPIYVASIVKTDLGISLRRVDG